MSAQDRNGFGGFSFDPKASRSSSRRRRAPRPNGKIAAGRVLDDDKPVLISDAEIDSGLHPLMALPETAERRYGKQQDSHRNWRLPGHRSSRGPGLSRSR